MEGTPTLNSILDTFGQPPVEEVPPAEPAPTEPAQPPVETPPAEPAAPAAQAPAQPAAPVRQPEEIFNGSKANATFAKMRVENTAWNNMGKRLSEMLGIQATTPEEILDGVNAKILEYESQTKKIPLDLLQEVEAGRTFRQQQEVKELRDLTLKGFQSVKDKYKLDDAGIAQYAQQLHDKGINPFETPVDLLDMYRLMNYDALIKQEREAAVAEELERQKRANTHSTTPGSTNSPGGSKAPATSLNDLIAGFKG